MNHVQILYFHKVEKVKSMFTKKLTQMKIPKKAKFLKIEKVLAKYNH